MSDEWVMVPRDLLQRVDAALQRHLDRHAPMRIPVDQTDSDLVQSDVQALIAAPAAPQQAGQFDHLAGRGMHELRFDELTPYVLSLLAGRGQDTPDVRIAIDWIVSELKRKTNDERALAVKLDAIRAAPQQAEPVWVRPDQLQKARQGRFLCALGSTQLAADMVPLYLRPDPQVQRLRDALRVILEADWTSDRIRNIARKALEGGA